MSPTLEAIPNIVSALPTASSAILPVQRAAGGFASTLAAAQSLDPTPQTGEVESSGAPVTENAGTSGNLSARIPAWQNPQLKKAPNSSSPVGAGTLAVGNIVVPALISTIVQIAPGPLQASLQSSLPLTSLATAPAAAAQVQLPGTPAETVSEMQTTAYDTAFQSTISAYSSLGQIAGSSPSLDGMPVKVNNLSTPVTSTPNKNSGQATASSTPSGVLTATAQASANVLLENASNNQGSVSEDRLSSTQATLLAESTPPAFPAPTGQSASSSVSLKLSADTQTGGFQAGGFGLQAPAPTPQRDQRVESAASTPTLLANANLEGGTAALLTSAAKLQTSPANSVPAIVPDTAAQIDLAAQTGAENPLPGTLNGQTSASAILNSSAQVLSTAVSHQFAAAKGGPAAPGANVHGAGSGAPATASNPASAMSTDSDSGNGSSMASQTPFSVFFSSPGPGAESAASALPKMIIPAGTNSAIRESQVNSNWGGPSANPQSGVQSGISQAPSAQNSNDSTAGTPSGNAQIAPGLRREDEKAASAQPGPLPTEGTQSPAVPSSAVATPPLQQPASPPDTLPKSTALPAPPQNDPAGSLSSPKETLAATAAGPVQMAQLVNRAEQSEMRIGMSTSAFGSVEVRTVVHANDVGLVIGSEKGDLRTLLANDLPAITNTLQQQSLRLNSVNFMQGFGFSNNASGDGNSQQRSFVPMRAPVHSAASEAADDSIDRPAVEFGKGSGSLSILA